MGKHWCMSNKFMNNIRFWCVFWARMVSNILGRVEYPECQSVKKFSLSQKTSYWFQSPTCFLLKKFRNLFKLRNFVFRKSFNMIFHFNDSFVGFLASIRLQKSFQFRITMFPNTNFIFTVFNSWDFGVTNLVIKSDLSNIISSCLVLFISETRMISFLYSIAF